MAHKIHFIGIGGIGVSGLARLYHHEGWEVSGSDVEDKPLLRALEGEGMNIFRTQTADNVNDTIDNFVYSAAVGDDNPELAAARATGKPVLDYFEALAQVANEYFLIAVAGAHGKTTTTAMLADILEEASFDPSVIVGSVRAKTGSNYRAGKSKYFIVEACEWRDHFLHLAPDVLVVTNIDHEHADYFADLAAVQASFRTLALKVPEAGAIIADATNSKVAPVLADVAARVVDYRSFVSPTRVLRQPGIHNQLNAAAALAAADFVGVERTIAEDALQHFAGTARRFEYKGDVNGAFVYEDYAHHPTELTAAIAGAREKYPDRKLIAVFQPHTFSRTRDFFDAFVTALSAVDSLVLVPIYAAREVDTGEVSSDMLQTAVQKTGTPAELFLTLPAAAEAVREQADGDSVVLVLGAGTVTQVAGFLTQG